MILSNKKVKMDFDYSTGEVVVIKANKSTNLKAGQEGWVHPDTIDLFVKSGDLKYVKFQ